MSAVIVDGLILVLVLAFAALGYAHGFIQSVSSFVGVVIGVLVGIRLAVLVGRHIDAAATRIGVVMAIVVLCAIAGQTIANYGARFVRLRLRRTSLSRLDRVLGGVVSAVVAVFLCWTIALPLAGSPIPRLSAAIKDSRLMPLIDEAMPPAARDLYAAMRNAVTVDGLPDVVGPLSTTDATPVSAPQSGLPSTPAIVAAGKSIVKVEGLASTCSLIIDGSGFVFAEHRVMTNAHVVAGTSSVKVRIGSSSYPATVVYDDEQTDVAVLDVPDMPLTPLAINTVRLPHNADIVVAGYPGGGAYQTQAGKVRSSGYVTGPTFRGTGTVARDVYSLAAKVIKGNSGGPLLDSSGAVVGLIFASAADNSDVGYALTQPEFAVAVAKGQAATAPVSSGACYG